MNETVILVLARGRGCLARCGFSSAAFGGRCAGAFRPNIRRSCFSAACCCERALPWLDFTLSPAVIGTGCWRVSSDLSSHAYRDAAHPSRGQANLSSTGGQPCALVPTRSSSGNTVFQTQRHHPVHVGTDARAGRRFKTHHAQTFHGLNVPAGRTFWKSSSPASSNKLKRSA
jgi:hypothetical protein